ncbi:MAG: MerR family transcriptional regulator [Proteobacteria bacterium]|nr:MerR family transcriptional regulator [Pseudomonadota bacterium]
MSVLLRVGELARRTGLTVRALHHYDRIGLLRPSGRSEGGYRLYGPDDIARLHGIQALRRLGLRLGDVAQLLDGGGAALPAIVAQLIARLDQDIVRAQALRERLGAMQSLLAGGGRPGVDDWLASLSSMNVLERYFSVTELRLILERWTSGAAQWAPLLQSIRDAMQRGVAPDALALQPLVRRWMDLCARWMNGDMALLRRWSSMLFEQPGLPLPEGMDRALIAYIDQAVQVRLDVLSRYIDADDFQRLDKTLDPQWHALTARAERLLADGTPPQAAAARRLAREWRALLDRTVRRDAGLAARLLAAYENEPLIRAGAAFTPAVLRYVQRAAALDPDAR